MKWGGKGEVSNSLCTNNDKTTVKSAKLILANKRICTLNTDVVCLIIFRLTNRLIGF